MRAGPLRDRLLIEQDLSADTDNTDDHGELAEDWQTWKPWFGSVTPLVGRERFAAQQVSADVTHKIRMRYLAGLTSRMRIRFEGRIFTIDAVLDIEELHKEQLVMCTERV